MKAKNVLLFVFLLVGFNAVAREPLYNYTFFSNSRMPGFYFYSKGIADQSSLKTVRNKLPLSAEIFHTPGNAIQLDYTNAVNKHWQASIYRQEIRGQDHFKPAKYLSFWVYKISAGTKSADLPSVQLIGKDSSSKHNFTFEVAAVKAWQQVIIPVSLTSSMDPTEVIGIGFSQNSSSGLRHVIYLDDIEFISDSSKTKIFSKPTILALKAGPKHVDITWPEVMDSSTRFVKIYRSTDRKNFKPVGIQSAFINRYADFTGTTDKEYTYQVSFLNDRYEESPRSAPKSATTRSMTDEELLDMVQEASFRYYWEGAEKNSGLSKENILGRHDMIATGASGFGIMAIIAATQRKFIPYEKAIQRFTRIVDFLDQTETFHGAFSHFVDGSTGKAEPFFGKRDNGGDLVETSFLMQGLLTARAFFKNDNPAEKRIRDRITSIWNKVEWNWYRQYPDSRFLYWHWSPDQGWVINHTLIGWNETMVTYLLAIASPTYAIPASMYYTGWANQDSIGQQYRIGWGQTNDGSMYTNGNSYFGIKLDVGVSNGGPLFFTHYSYLGYDPHLLADKYTNYFKNNQAIALINHRYCIQNPGNYKGYGDSCWGLTASDGPYTYAANEPVLRQDRGVMAPTGAISSFPYTPVESMKALKNYYHNYGSFLWGEYGFRDAFNLTENWCADIYMGLNQAPMTVMIENYRSGLLWNLFMSSPDIKKGLEKLAAETARLK